MFFFFSPKRQEGDIVTIKIFDDNHFMKVYREDLIEVMVHILSNGDERYYTTEKQTRIIDDRNGHQHPSQFPYSHHFYQFWLGKCEVV